jgi:hypothetical protein
MTKRLGKWKIFIVIFIVIFALMVLFVSISRISLEMTQEKDKSDQIRKLPIDFVVKNDDDSVDIYAYKLPYARTLPDDSSYYLKRVRDFFWIVFTAGNKEKSEVVLFIADKKIAEANELFKKGKTDLALKTSREALNKLQYANYLYKHKDNRIYKAGLAYKQILKNYQQKIEELDNWNEKQKK